MKQSVERRAELEREAQRKCRAAKDLVNAGDYEAARSALSGLWVTVGERPQLDKLQARTQAEVLLRVGALSGWLGSARQLPGAQEFAKELITESIRGFESLGDQEKVAEAQTDLAICYWREGAMDEARVWFHEAFSRAASVENKFRVLVNSTTVEISSNRLIDALALLDQAGALLDQIEDCAAKGRYHMQRAIALKRLGGVENLDRAFIENTAASIHFEQAGHKRYFARVENNIGFILLELGRYREALAHLEKARNSFIELRDVGSVAQVNETRARVFLVQGLYSEAEKTADLAVSVLVEGGERSLLAEALVTQGIALARMGQQEIANKILKRSAEIAEKAGDLESAARALLTIIEELHSLSAGKTAEIYLEADQKLGDQLDPQTIKRLRACARLALVRTTSAIETERAVIGSSLDEEVLHYERELIRNALEQAKGSVTRAARLLGVSHQGLCYIINGRHKELLAARTPVRLRRKSIIKKN